MNQQGTQAPAQSGQVDLQAGEQKQRRDAERGQPGERPVVRAAGEHDHGQHAEPKGSQRAGILKRCSTRGTTIRPKIRPM